MTAVADRRRALRAACTHFIHGFTEPTPAALFAGMADWCTANNIQHDFYGRGDLIGAFEHKIATLLGLPAAVFMPSGIMAQAIALRIWAERKNLQRFGLHATSHLELHEMQSYQALSGLQGVRLGAAHRPVLASDLLAHAEPLACAVIEMPMREIGGQMPGWDELKDLKAAARQLNMPLHMDGARLWEIRACYQHSYAEIVDGFASVYVSTYKGIGGIGGAVLAGDAAFIAAARAWRRRMGGTLVHLSPLVISSAMLFDSRLAQMDALYSKTLELADILNTLPGVRTEPRNPQANMLHIIFEGDADALLQARDVMAGQDLAWLFSYVEPAGVPGFCRTEIYVGDQLLQWSAARIKALFGQLMAHAALAVS